MKKPLAHVYFDEWNFYVKANEKPVLKLRMCSFIQEL